MTTIARRTIRSSPHRTSTETWNTIVDLLAQENQDDARRKLLAITGIASSVIMDQAPGRAPIIVTCDGPRTRIYCLYGEDAIEGAEANEERLGFEPLNGEWMVSLPCQAADLSWVQEELKKYGSRITARDLATGLELEKSSASASAQSMVLNVKGFLGS
ncbi:hypothetical protein POL68_29760 [Stigmatella sp. ncwal1]|uniref:Uncharacterized protein n=1 Tax=Stigmatella ashevillensis TaxID=2995309 RepID=A0ABT5DHS4_9BACT|nr:hypothetical protein [Stigmatella ashevillena]MDC0712685.1 hypothetical protein [Stigmatella ashevillena]